MENSLSRMRPHLVSEWSDKNLPLTPDTVTFGSNTLVWWKGACGHEWQTSVKARSSGEKCPICSGARVIEGINVQYVRERGCFEVTTTLKVSSLSLRRNGRPRMSR